MTLWTTFEANQVSLKTGCEKNYVNICRKQTAHSSKFSAKTPS